MESEPNERIIFTERLKLSNTSVIGAGYSKGELVRLEKYDRNYIGVSLEYGEGRDAYNETENPLNLDWDKPCFITRFEKHLKSKKFDSIRFDSSVQNFFIGTVFHSLGYPESLILNREKVLSALISKLKQNGKVYLEEGKEDKRLGNPLKNFFEKHGMTVYCLHNGFHYGYS